MNLALSRFRKIERAYKALLPRTRRELSRREHHDLLWASSLSQVIEAAEAEMAIGKPHDVRLIKEMRLEVAARLGSVGIYNT